MGAPISVIRGHRVSAREGAHSLHEPAPECPIGEVPYPGDTSTRRLPPTSVVMGDGGPYVVLGVMSNPFKPFLRNQWREWASTFNSSGRGVHVRYVFGRSVWTAGVDPGPSTADVPMVRSETGADHFFVDGREKLPNVGVVTEKSATFWRSAAAAEPRARWYCKCDDDTLVHLDRLQRTLAFIEAQRPGAATYFGHMKWRGWDVDDRFQACGGTWGDAPKTAEDIVKGGTMPTTPPRTYPPCPHAAGPYPYMSGGMVCMSAPLARRMAADGHFAHFVAKARERNTHGTPCRKPRHCAAQGADVHMWHHEDAGIGYNVFRAVVGQNATAHLVPVPAHFNDPCAAPTRPARLGGWQLRGWQLRGWQLRGWQPARGARVRPPRRLACAAASSSARSRSTATISTGRCARCSRTA